MYDSAELKSKLPWCKHIDFEFHGHQTAGPEEQRAFLVVKARDGTSAVIKMRDGELPPSTTALVAVLECVFNYVGHKMIEASTLTLHDGVQYTIIGLESNRKPPKSKLVLDGLDPTAADQYQDCIYPIKVRRNIEPVVIQHVDEPYVGAAGIGTGERIRSKRVDDKVCKRTRDALAKLKSLRG